MKTMLRHLFGCCLILISSLAQAATVPPPCGTQLLDVVIMLDRTTSVSSTERDAEASAAKNLLDTFISINGGHRVAIGAFNANPKPSTASAEIEASLSSNYANLKSVVDTAMSSSSGGTNVEAAIKISQDELTANGASNSKKVIVLVSDGQTNARLTDQTCTSASGYSGNTLKNECSAYKAGLAAKDAGIIIYAVAYDALGGDDTSVAGRALLAAIATQPSDDDTSGAITSGSSEQNSENLDGDNFFIAPNAELTAIFNQIGGSILCDDGDACTNDLCSQSNQCVFTPIDSDEDGNADCKDGCPLDSNKDAPGQCGCGALDTDSDKDGTADCVDQCPNDKTKILPGVCGCGIADVDDDKDGTMDCQDQCPQDSSKVVPGQCGCGVADTDSDEDGIPDCNDVCPEGSNADSDEDQTPDCRDQCPNDPAKTLPGQCGCGVADVDADSDGTADCNDQCPNDPAKIAPATCGCNVAEVDTDKDGYLNCVDACPDDTGKINPGVCGCGVSDVDSDQDGTPDCNDQCFDGEDRRPLALTKDDNLTKVVPGQCGCGVPDTDSDGDGTADCNDLCPNDASKLSPGACGCNVSDVDTDGDETSDCNDQCPSDSAKVYAGYCGCGVADGNEYNYYYEGDYEGVVCFDDCPNDPNKTDPGQCGCGTEDVDTDGDETANCNDQCPSDADKVTPGECGCGFSDTDSNDNGIADCNEPTGNETPLCTDSDDDGICDEVDNCPAIANADQSDSDDNGVGDACDVAPVVVVIPAGTGVAGGRNCSLNPNANFGDMSTLFIGLLFMGGLFVLRSGRKVRKQFLTLLLVGFLTLTLSVPSWALNVQKWRPSTGQTSGQAVQTSETLPKYHFAAGLNVNLANHPFEQTPANRTSRLAGIVDQFVTADALLQYGLTDWATINVDVPVNLYHNIAPTFIPTRDKSGGDFGDIQLSAKFRAYDVEKTKSGLGLAFVPFITFPSGDAGIFFGESNVTGGLTVVGDWKFMEKNRLSANAGIKLRKTENVGNLRVKHELLYGLAYERNVVKDFDIIAEIFGSANTVKFAREDITSPLEGDVTLRKKWGKNSRLVTDLTGGMGITNGYGLPNYRIAAGLSYAWDLGRKAPAAVRRVDLSSEVLFDFAKFNLKSAVVPVLDEFVGSLSKTKYSTITVEGHTDAVGSDASNMKLSQRRAGSIKSYLERKGVDANKVNAVGYGESQPVATNDTAEGRQKNRRAVLIVK